MERHRRPAAIRDALEARYPGTSWSVRLARTVEAITVVRWTDGPTEDEARSVVYDHEGRLNVRLERRSTAAPGADPENLTGSGRSCGAVAIPEGAPVGCPIPYDDSVCGSCGGRLHPDGDHPFHLTTGSPLCPCARCGRSLPSARLYGDAVICGECHPARDPVVVGPCPT